ncbi:lipoprotein BA_5634 family protein [Paenibacillus sp. UMB4589-SE434]|uniref:lipoprotein BA_5634 family protein n=1 Tax=Paenibacillus sp. UMB4589-SE434 TaxID=3046314 RepID=UPI00254A5B25|nr:lipoprotein BA_5634 family protein [Paenibacillus sp. UMB4589-SE434]MDK8181991.1 lipoprotein BA_5634 family protein [Paenibacillus sp. UMB4589-SE434]
MRSRKHPFTVGIGAALLMLTNTIKRSAYTSAPADSIVLTGTQQQNKNAVHSIQKHVVSQRTFKATRIVNGQQACLVLSHSTFRELTTHGILQQVTERGLQNVTANLSLDCTITYRFGRSPNQEELSLLDDNHVKPQYGGFIVVGQGNPYYSCLIVTDTISTEHNLSGEAIQIAVITCSKDPKTLVSDILQAGSDIQLVRSRRVSAGYPIRKASYHS